MIAAIRSAKSGHYADAEKFFHKAAAMTSPPGGAPTDVFFFRGAIANAKGNLAEARRQWAESITSLRYGEEHSPEYSTLWGLNSAYMWMATSTDGRL